MAMGEIPASGVTISDLYHELVALRTDVAAALSKMERTNERAAAAERAQSDHEARLRALENAIPSSLEVRIMTLEKFRWQVLGALLAINTLGIVIEWLLWAPKK